MARQIKNQPRSNSILIKQSSKTIRSKKQQKKSKVLGRHVLEEEALNKFMSNAESVKKQLEGAKSVDEYERIYNAQGKRIQDLFTEPSVVRQEATQESTASKEKWIQENFQKTWVTTTGKTVGLTTDGNYSVVLDGTDAGRVIGVGAGVKDFELQDSRSYRFAEAAKDSLRKAKEDFEKKWKQYKADLRRFNVTEKQFREDKKKWQEE